ncbi:hypothetical protein DFP72DRAFT_927109 [Ephemerocybe angulata]|uniref:F-box domain-containing protein n=1 Tax=Ephemerocybe angulata TaxID=980116 RepID=A0A8H6HEF2_9AGAR|nr:hypothetical protein DFP72DRAFT_927109 [Tulosesus angulatus]
MERRRSACTEFLHLHVNILYGVRGLPDEVLEAIFHHVLQAAPERHRSLYCILRTSHRWRQVSLMSPRLWSVLPDMIGDDGEGFFAHPNVSPFPFLREFIDLYLQLVPGTILSHSHSIPDPLTTTNSCRNSNSCSPTRSCPSVIAGPELSSACHSTC